MPGMFVSVAAFYHVSSCCVSHINIAHNLVARSQIVSFLNDIFWLLGQVWQKKCLQEAEMTLSLLKTQRKLN